MNPYLKEIEKLQQGNFQSVYLLYGEEYFLTDFFIRTARDAFKLKRRGAFRSFLAVEQKDMEFIKELSSISMFEPAKLIVYKEIASMKPKFRKDLQNYLQKPNEENILIMTQSAYVRPTAFFRGVQQASRQIKTDPPDEREFEQYVRHYVKNRNCRIDDDAVILLMDMVGTSLSGAFNELDKVLLFIDYQGRITKEHIKEVALVTKQYGMDNLQRAIGKKDLAESLSVGLYLLANGSPIQYIITSLTHFFQNLWIYNQPTEKLQGLNSFEKLQANRLRPYFNHYPARRIGRVLNFLQDADLESKTTSKKPENILVPLLYRIVND